jgi:hypothetical protein
MWCSIPSQLLTLPGWAPRPVFFLLDNGSSVRGNVNDGCLPQTEGSRSVGASPLGGRSPRHWGRSRQPRGRRVDASPCKERAALAGLPKSKTNVRRIECDSRRYRPADSPAYPARMLTPARCMRPTNFKSSGNFLRKTAQSVQSLRQERFLGSQYTRMSLGMYFNRIVVHQIDVIQTGGHAENCQPAIGRGFGEGEPSNLLVRFSEGLDTKVASGGKRISEQQIAAIHAAKGAPLTVFTETVERREQRGHRSEVIGGGWRAEGRAGGVRTRSKPCSRVRARRCPVASKRRRRRT